MNKWLRSLGASAQMFRRPRSLVVTSALLAIQVALGLVASISIGPNIRISFGYLALATTGALFGPVPALTSGALADVLLFLVRPTGPYFPGFTLSGLLGGLIYGSVLYDRDIKLWHVLLSKLLIDVLVNLLLNTLWLDMLYGKAFFVILPARALKNLAQYPVDVLLLYPLLKFVKRLQSRGQIPA